METERGIWRWLLLLDPELFADVHVVHHQLVGGVDDAPPYLVLSPIHLVIWHQIQYRDHICPSPSQSPVVLLNGLHWPL